jgi:hypothetical protein
MSNHLCVSNSVNVQNYHPIPKLLYASSTIASEMLFKSEKYNYILQVSAISQGLTSISVDDLLTANYFSCPAFHQTNVRSYTSIFY